MKLFNILKEQILTEGRKEDVMKKFPEATEIIEALSDLDPSGNNKYLDWATKTYVKELGNKFDADAVGRLTDAIRVYHEKEALLTKSNMEEFIEFLHEDGDNIFDADTIEKIQARPKDINVFPTSAAFGKFVTWLSSFKSKKKELEESTKKKPNLSVVPKGEETPEDWKTKVARIAGLLDKAPEKPKAVKEEKTPSAPIYATNPQTGQRIMSTDGGKTWTGVK